MNASKQAQTIGALSKISSVARIILSEFPSATLDLSPWLSDSQDDDADPTSIDYGVSFGTFHEYMNCRCMLIQVCFSEIPHISSSRMQGIIASGHNHDRQCWKASSLHRFELEGIEIEKLSTVGNSNRRKIENLFNRIYALYGYHSPLHK